ncbi:MAG: hypothetical protein JNM30_07990 [Rhodospirillales bacterium]|nr:hypothetical protein [Rhodospirillales bacterium]
MALAFEADRGISRADGFWAAATLSAVALTVAASEARAEPKRTQAQARIVAVCSELAELADHPETKLVGSIALSLGEFVRQSDLDQPALEVIAGHLEALRAVLRHTIQGDGGPVGRQIMAGLKASVAQRVS